MQSFRLVILAASVVVAGFGNAMAFSIDKDSGNFSDGSPRFVDPDEQDVNFQGGSQVSGDNLSATNSNNVGLYPIGRQPVDRSSNAYMQSYFSAHRNPGSR